MPDARSARITRLVEEWFASHQRALPWRLSYDPYGVWISEVMLQQTRMEVVLGRYAGFLRRFPTLRSLALSDETAVLTAWSGLGYYRRARMLHAAAREIEAKFQGVVPRELALLLTVPGIGRYTAGAIASIAHDERAPIVDGNVARILSRLYGIDEATGSTALMRTAWQASERLVAACHSPRMFNQGLMELGALVCTPRNPSCPQCPLRRACVAFREDRAADLPRAKKRAETRRLRIPLYIITDARGRVLLRRERGPLMDTLFHLPHGNRELFNAEPLDVLKGKTVGRFLHTITNRRIEFIVRRAVLGSRRPRTYAWIADLAEVAHPSYVAKAWQLAGEAPSS